jgi:superfamily II DNA or RNA helicase
MPVPDFSRVEKLRDGQDKILLAVASADGGQLVGGTGIGKSFLIVQICRMYPRLKIVIVSPRKSVVSTLHERLTAAIGYSDVGMVGGGKYVTDRRVTVATAKSITRAPIKDCDLLLFDEVHGVGYNKIANDLAYVTRARKFGFPATPTGRGYNAELVIESLFGPILADIPYDDAVGKGLVTPIEVHKYIVNRASNFNAEGSAVTKKRHGYWRNKTRNEMIAAVARMSPADEQVLIMVETLEHAIYLHKLLPEFEVVHYGGANKKKVIGGVYTGKYKMNDKRSSYLRNMFSKGKIKKVIATTVWKEGVDFPELSVLIRADGITSPIMSNQIPGRLSRLSSGKQVGVLVDFEDKFCVWAERRSKARMKVYTDTGWRIINKDII